MDELGGKYSLSEKTVRKYAVPAVAKLMDNTQKFLKDAIKIAFAETETAMFNDPNLETEFE